MLKFLKQLIPPRQWQIPVIVLCGAIVGLVIYLFQISNAISYLSDDPKTCINCHVMTPEYLTWQHGSHGKVTTCNDCHVPHTSEFSKYYFKAKDGLYHSYVFTTRQEPEVIVMKEESAEVVHNNCIRCHQDQVLDTKSTAWIPSHKTDRLERKCWECHRETPHGKVKSLSAVGYQIDPKTRPKATKPSVVPEWILKQIESNNK